MSGAPSGARPFAARLALVTALALALRLAWLPGQPPLGDDRAAGVSAVNFVERGQVGPSMWHHPRVRDLAVYASLTALGPRKVGLVFPSLLLGVLAVPVVGLLGRRLAGERAGWLAALLLAIDPVHVDFSRQAVQDVYTTLFGAAGVLLALRHLDVGRTRWAIAAGAVFGLGLASKWSVAFPLAVTVAFCAWWRAREPGPSPGERVARIATTTVALVLVPAAVYVATWAPWFAAGRDLFDWVVLQRAMAAEAATHQGFVAATLELPHRALAWFLWPTWFADSVLGPGGPAPVVAVTNPVTWLPTLPALAWAIVAARRRGAPEHALLAALVLATWLPFAALARPIWLHSALAVLPFSLITVAVTVDGLAGQAARGRRVVAAFVTAAVLAATPLAVLATGVASGVPGLGEVARSFRPRSTLPPGAP